MIISGLPEDRILEELIVDSKIIANEAKKIAKKAILRLQMSGRDGIDDDVDFTKSMTTTKNNNSWFVVVVINMAKNPKWYHQAVCYHESGYGTKDYYIVRGFSKNKPYYIKFSSHALKRVKERLFHERLGNYNQLQPEWIPALAIRKGEIISWMKITDPRLLKTVFESEDRHTINTLFYTSYGCYLGYETEKGNVEFNTFLNNNQELKKAEENVALYMCKLAHVAYNKKLYSKEYIAKVMNDEEIIPDMIGEVLMDYRDKFILWP